MAENKEQNNNSFHDHSEIDKTFIEGENFEEYSEPVSEDSGSLSNTGININNKTGSFKLPDVEDIKKNPDRKIFLASGFITDVLGTGGMAKIYKVWNDKLEIFRAVKVLLPDQDENIARRFETEAKITAKLDHKNIIKIFNVGEWNNLPYIEMEYIDGIPLSTMINRFGKIEPPVCCAIAMALLKALSYARNQEVLLYGKAYKGIIHRDLKPANIMVSRDGNVILMDFGIARPAETSLHTMEGNIVGTLPYLSPEQLDNADVNYMTDIYSFGTIIYEMLTGEKTFPQQTITNLIKNKATGNYRKFDNFDFQIDSRLSKTVSKCLESEKEKRPSDYDMLFSIFQKTYYSFTKEKPADFIKSFIQGIPLKTSRIPHVKNLSFRNNRITVLLSIPGMLIVIASILFFFKNSTITPQKSKEKKHIKMAIIKKDTAATVTHEDQKDDSTAPSQIPTGIDASSKISPKQPALHDRTHTPVTIKKATRNTVKKPILKKRDDFAVLEEKYGTKNTNDIINRAWTKKNYQDIATALKKTDPENGFNDKQILYILDSYIRLNKYPEAIRFISDKNVNDAYFDFAKGKTEDHIGNYKKALKLFESSMTKPSHIFSNIEIRRDALYHIAMVHDKQYNDGYSEKACSAKLKAWENVEKIYRNTPEHSRYKTAKRKISTLNKLIENNSQEL